MNHYHIEMILWFVRVVYNHYYHQQNHRIQIVVGFLEDSICIWWLCDERNNGWQKEGEAIANFSVEDIGNEWTYTVWLWIAVATGIVCITIKPSRIRKENKQEQSPSVRNKQLRLEGTVTVLVVPTVKEHESSLAVSLIVVQMYSISSTNSQRAWIIISSQLDRRSNVQY